MWQSYTASKMAQLQLDDEKRDMFKIFIQKNKMQNWYPSQPKVESICARNVNIELHFFENNNFNTIANKLHLQQIDVVLLPGPYKVTTMLGVRVHLHLFHPVRRLTLVDPCSLAVKASLRWLRVRCCGVERLLLW